MPKSKPLPPGFTRRKDGLLQYRFTFVESRYSVYGRTVKDCLQKADEKRDKLKQGVKIEAGKITFEEYVKEWLTLHTHSLRESSAIFYEHSFNRVFPLIGHIKLIDLDRRDILKVQAELLKKYSTATTNQTISNINTIFRAAVMDRIIVYNPCDGIKAIRRVEPKMTKTSHRALTIEEQKEFFAKAREKKAYYYHLFVFLIQTGVRVGEALALSWDDIDYKNNLIHISKTVTRTRAGYAIGDIPKTEAGNRDIPLTKDIKNNLIAQREKMIAVHGLSYAKKNKRIFLQRHNPDSPINVTSITVAIGTVLSKTQIAHFSAHAFRDTFATRAIEQGMPPNTLKEIMGHSSITMTMNLYAQVIKKEKEESMNRLVIVL